MYYFIRVLCSDVFSLAYMDTLKGFKQLDTEQLDKEEYKYNSIYLTAVCLAITQFIQSEYVCYLACM
jgi:hypothetical protein